MELWQKPMEWSGERTSTHCKVQCKDECTGTSDPSKRWVESGDPFSTQRKKGGWKLDPKPLSTATVERERKEEGREGKERRGDKAEEEEVLRKTTRGDMASALCTFSAPSSSLSVCNQPISSFSSRCSELSGAGTKLFRHSGCQTTELRDAAAGDGLSRLVAQPRASKSPVLLFLLSIPAKMENFWLLLCARN